MQSMNNRIQLFFAGDFCSKPTTSFITPSDELKSLLSSCDCRIVNFEVPLKPEIELPERKEERFFQNDDAPAFLRNLGFDLFSIANNHIFDWGDEGYKKTKACLGDSSFGAGTFEEAYKVKEVEIKGKRIGFLALSYVVYTWALQDTNQREGLGCAYINDLKVNHVIIEAKNDWTICLCYLMMDLSMLTCRCRRRLRDIGILSIMVPTVFLVLILIALKGGRNTRGNRSFIV